MTYKKSGHEKILVINDGKRLAESMRAVFEITGLDKEYEVINAASYKDGLEKITSGEEFSLIILRIKKNERNPYGLVNKLIKQGKSPPLTFLVKNENDKYLERLRNRYPGEILFHRKIPVLGFGTYVYELRNKPKLAKIKKRKP